MSGRPESSAANPLTASNGTPSLDALRERVRSPDGGREDLDALLAEIDRPFGAGEDARERAKQLRRIVADPWLAQFTGSDGRRANEAAEQVLRAMGEPLSDDPAVPDSTKAGTVDAATEEEGLTWRHIAAVLLLVLATVEGAVMLGTFPPLGPVLALIFTGPTVLWPALVLMSRPGAHNRFSYNASATLAGLSIPPLVLLPMVFVGLLQLFFGVRKPEFIQAAVFGFVLVRIALVFCLLIARHEEPEPT